MDPAERPDPDRLLRQVQEAERAKHRARLRIFFGFAPGVGKTYRMLQVAREARDHGVDVVVGIVETHKRKETMTLLEGFPSIPRRQIPYRGHTLEELDLDAALVRKPKLLLVDELAHTNAPGSRHAKRWQDVLELLDAGIDVYTTVNVQHVESLNDVVAQITQVRVRETIPDSILERADEMELVDISPEELLQRLKEGKVYLPEQAQRAAQHFFQRGNLLALRELALRRTAQHVDRDVLEYREAYGVQVTWPTAERLLVCIGPSPSSGHVIRAAYRMAVGLRCPWIAAYVDRTTGRPLSEKALEHLDANLALAESLGATVVRLSGSSVSAMLLAHARKSNVTRILIGKPTHSRVQDRLFGSLLDEVVRGSGDIDVHAISGAEPEDEVRSSAAAPRKVAISWAAYGKTTLLVLATTVFSLGVRSLLPVPDLEVLYLVAVMFSAIRYGRGPSIFAAFLGVCSYDFFFVPPYLTFAVADVRYLLTFALMFGVGLVVSELTSRLRRQETDAVFREQRMSVLYGLSRELASATDAFEAARTVARSASDVFDATAFVLRPRDGDALEVTATWPAGASFDGKDTSVAQWAHEHGRSAGLGTSTLPGSRVVCFPIRIGSTGLGVLALLPPDGAPLPVEQHEFVEAYTRQAAFAFERSRLIADAQAGAVRVKAEEMRSSLLSAVSHDLRTPLAAITGAASALRDAKLMDGDARSDLLETVVVEAERLERLVANLLEMTRLHSGAVALQRAWMPLEEMVSSALARLENPIGERVVHVDLASAPLVFVDPVLFEQVFVNLFENAAKYTPAGTPIDVDAHRGEGTVVIEVADRGPGLVGGTEQQVFEKFYRGAHPGVRGVGLGLPICKAIVEAHGGTIGAENRPDGGALFRITLPLSGEPPRVDAGPPTREPAVTS
jgi:two-component system sensor histidine kinase KdpD